MRILYLTYDGILDPLMQSQVVKYLILLSKKCTFSVLSFEKPNDVQKADRLKNQQRRFAKHKIDWQWLRYHKTPALLSTAWDILQGYRAAKKVIKEEDIGFLHGRSHVPGMIMYLLKKKLNIPYIFDMRGFMPEERVDARQWTKESIAYKVTKYFEKKIIAESDAIILLTKRGKKAVEQLPEVKGKIPVSYIPTCVDTNQFKQREWAKKELKDRFVLLYVGSGESWYDIPGILKFFRALQRKEPMAYFLVLSRDRRVEERVAKELAPEAFKVQAVPHEDMPAWISMAHTGICLARPGKSLVARNPTKIGEYLACGLPVVLSSGIGDWDEIIQQYGVGIIARPPYEKAVQQFQKLLKQKGLKKRCRSVAMQELSLQSGVKEYAKIYQKFQTRKKKAH